MTTTEAGQVGGFRLGKGRYDLLIRVRYIHHLQPLMLDGRGANGTADESSLCRCVQCVVGLSLLRPFSLVVG